MKLTNKIQNAVTCLAIGLALSGCELTKFPEDTISPDAYFGNASQLELWTNGFYAQLDNAETVAATNADDNIDNTLGDVLMGQRSAADSLLTEVTGAEHPKIRFKPTNCALTVASTV